MLKLTSRNNECTYLRFDIPNNKLGPESNSRLRAKMAKFSDVACRERRKRISNQDYFKLSELINFKYVVDTVDNFIDFQDNSSDSMWF